MKIGKRIISLLLTIIMVVSLFTIIPVTANAAGSDTAEIGDTSGTTGDCTWTLNGTVLTISGNGAMEDYGLNDVPWFPVRSDITEVIITKGVTNIGSNAFDGCDSLTSMTIPNSVTSIGREAFWGCTSLTSVTIPDSVTSIGWGAFEACDSLKSVTIPDSVTTIDVYAFEGCDSLTSVTIGNSVTSIGEWAFLACNNLKSVTIGNSVTSIGDCAFEQCTSLTSVTIPDSVTSIGHGAFYGCTGLTSVTIGNSVTSIGYDAFYECSSLISVTIGNSVTSIGEAAFKNCSSLKSVIIPDSVTDIGEWAFESCSGLTSVTIGNSVTSISWGAFLNCSSMTSLTIGNSVTSIGDDAFENCSSLKSVIIPDSVTSIDLCAFRGCTSLTSVTIPNSVTYIGSEAFEKCDSLTSVTIPASVSIIGMEAFGYHSIYDRINEVYDFTKVEGFTIKGYYGTAAEKYAKDNSFSFVSLGHLTTPKLTKVENTVDGVKITIDKVNGAAKYRYYRKTGTGSWQKLGDTDKTTWTDKTASSGTKYTYTVRCLSADGKYFTSDFDKTGKSITFIAAPKITKLENVASGTRITWSSSKGAAKYRVYYKTGSSGWTKLADTSSTTYLNTKVKGGVKYTYTVRCISNDAKSFTSSYDANGKSYYFFETPPAPTLKNTKNGVSISWKKSVGASTYRVYRKTGNGSWTKLGDTTNTSYVDKTAKSGTTYSYTIRCISKDKKSFTSGYNAKGSTIKCKR